MRLAAALAMLTTPLAAEEALSPFARNVVLHVLLHEGGHAVLQTFGLPVLTNEEDMADAFATITLLGREGGVDAIADRIRSWRVEQAEAGWPGDGTDPFDDPQSAVWGEHRLDAQRAFDAACLIYGSGPADFPEVPALFGMSENDATECGNYVSGIQESWEAVLAPHRRPEGETPAGVEVVYGDGPLAPAIRASGVAEETAAILGAYDWPALLTIVVDGCDEGAWWDDEARSLMLCDAYVARFVAQEALAALRSGPGGGGGTAPPAS